MSCKRRIPVSMNKEQSQLCGSNSMHSEGRFLEFVERCESIPVPRKLFGSLYEELARALYELPIDDNGNSEEELRWIARSKDMARSALKSSEITRVNALYEESAIRKTSVLDERQIRIKQSKKKGNAKDNGTERTINTPARKTERNKKKCDIDSINTLSASGSETKEKSKHRQQFKSIIVDGEKVFPCPYKDCEKVSTSYAVLRRYGKATDAKPERCFSVHITSRCTQVRSPTFYMYDKPEKLTH